MRINDVQYAVRNAQASSGSDGGVSAATPNGITHGVSGPDSKESSSSLGSVTQKVTYVEGCW